MKLEVTLNALWEVVSVLEVEGISFLPLFLNHLFQMVAQFLHCTVISFSPLQLRNCFVVSFREFARDSEYVCVLFEFGAQSGKVILLILELKSLLVKLVSLIHNQALDFFDSLPVDDDDLLALVDHVQQLDCGWLRVSLHLPVLHELCPDLVLQILELRVESVVLHLVFG